MIAFRCMAAGSILFAAGSVLAGCGESTISTVPSGIADAKPPSPHTRRNHSWMQPGASKGDLLYVSDTNENQVDVYTYPAGKLAGSLTGFTGLAFICVDKAGNVYVPSYGASKIFKYAHGGTKPLATLKDGRAEPYSCAIDPRSGNLAVANFYDNAADGDVAIYRHAKGEPQTYIPYDIKNDYFVTYDNAGNLFVESGSPAGSGGYFGLEELPKGARLFTPITLENVPAFPNGLQWEGSYLAVGTGTLAGPSSGDTYVYHVHISQFVGKTVGTTQLKERGPTANFFIDGSSIAVSGGQVQPSVGFFPYPKGGAPTQSLTQTAPFGIAVSAGAR